MNAKLIVGAILAAGAVLACTSGGAETKPRLGYATTEDGWVSVFYVQKPSGRWVQCVRSSGVSCDWENSRAELP